MIPVLNLSRSEISSILRSHELRPTKIRIAVIDLLQNDTSALSHSEIEKRLEMNVDRVTLFRTLNNFTEKNIVHRIVNDNSVASYALCDLEKCTVEGHSDKHVHFKCDQCGKIYCVALNNSFYPKISTDFVITEWKISVEGICYSCVRGDHEN